MITVSKKSYATIYWNEELKAVELWWEGEISSEGWRQGLTETLATVKQYKSSRLLIDDRKLRVVLPEDQQWAVQVLIPQFEGAGIRKLASISPESVVAQMSINRMVRKVVATESGTAFQMLFFTTPEEGRAWLMQ